MCFLMKTLTNVLLFFCTGILFLLFNILSPELWEWNTCQTTFYFLFFFLLLLLLFWSFFFHANKNGYFMGNALEYYGQTTTAIFFLLSLTTVHVKTNSEDCWWFVLVLFVVIKIYKKTKNSCSKCIMPKQEQGAKYLKLEESSLLLQKA